MNLIHTGRRLTALLVIVLLASALGGCGNKGPLYLPSPGSPSAAQPAAGQGGTSNAQQGG